MDVTELKQTLEGLADRVGTQKEMMQTEEATKNGLVMPLINALGYNVFDPLQVTPEFIADVGTKKGEKVDYAIKINGAPMILIECKSIGTKLGFDHASQLYRYFGVSDSRFAILTNGRMYWFYTDLDSPNRMDTTPFFELDLCDFDKGDIEELAKFSKATFDLDNILANATELKYVSKMMSIIESEYKEPSEDFVKYITNRVYNGRITSSVCKQFAPLVSSAFKQFIAGSINTRLRTAFSSVESDVVETSNSEKSPEPDDGIITTQEEIEGFHIVRAILAKQVDPARVVMRDTKSYCGILLDNNNRKPICRLHFNAKQLYLGVFDSQKNEDRKPIDRPRDIYSFADELTEQLSNLEKVDEQ